MYIYIYIYIYVHSGTQSVQCHKRTNSEPQQTRFDLKGLISAPYIWDLRNSFPHHKEVHFASPQILYGGTQSVLSHWRPKSEQQQTRYVLKGLMSATNN